ncbi:unnamed protein product [Vicia faba]|uniref:Uncharacterized protein n=1 Tax=Vicia faba TaxID=3906 RepID=A0AAV1AZL2_VICFA|nr:unnamed protein product [Vicia faba]
MGENNVGLIVIVGFYQWIIRLKKSKKRFKKNMIKKKRPPYMFTGHDLWEAVRDFPKVTDSGWATKFPGYGKQHNWIKRSIFWDLPYWKENLLRNNLDVMHIENNVFDNVFNTVMNDPAKTKDNEKAILDF